VLERLLAGVSPRAKRGITLAMVATGWIGFLVAVLSGLVLGLIFILIGFVLCWFAASMLAVKPTIAAGERASEKAEEHAAANGGVEPAEPADIEARIKRRLEAMKQDNPENESSTETEAET
jgi:hypothetical protein